jgi:hypothetical protein
MRVALGEKETVSWKIAGVGFRRACRLPRLARRPDLILPAMDPKEPKETHVSPTMVYRRQVPDCPICGSRDLEGKDPIAPTSHWRWFECTRCQHLWSIGESPEMLR